jgi:hypothetical protein
MNQKIIIFEGVDRVGKSTIARELSKRVSIPYFKNERESKNFLNPSDYFINTLRYSDPYFLSFLKQTGYSAIIDRQYPSEWVYSKVFQRTTDLDALKRTDQMFASLGAVIVICWRSDHEHRYDDQFPSVIDDEKLWQLHDAYCDFENWTSCKFVYLNVDDENLERETDDLLVMLDMNSFRFQKDDDRLYLLSEKVELEHLIAQTPASDYLDVMSLHDRLNEINSELLLEYPASAAAMVPDDPYDDADEFAEPDTSLQYVSYSDPDLDWSDADWEEK